MNQKRLFCRMAKTLLTLATGLICAASSDAASFEANDFRVGKKEFLLNGKPFVIRAGELHYPRIPKPYWDHRIKMTKALGMNAVCIYLFWNYHEKNMDEFNFKGDRDIAEFVRLIQKNGMYCILRPGPYVCAEWEMGGLPWWLLKKKDVRIRTFQDPFFRERAKKWFREVGKQLAPYQIQNGGPIILVQVENEYAGFGNDSEYMKETRDILRESGFDKVEMVRCDWDSNYMRYKLDDVAIALNFGAGSNIESKFSGLQKTHPDMPLMCGEYWTGWFDAWGRRHETRSVSSFIGSLKDMMDRRISFSLYMAHGGTTFGIWSGANTPPYRSFTSSYDYNAPISEAGWRTDKFDAVRALLKDYLNPGEALAPVPDELPVMEIPEIRFSQFANLFDNLPDPVRSETVMPMEMYDQGYGSILYRTKLPQSAAGKTIRIREPHDWAVVYLNGKRLAVFDRGKQQEALAVLPKFSGKATLDIFVENNGRVNFGPGIIDRKGITESVELLSGEGGTPVELKNWQVFRLPVDSEFRRAKKWTTKLPNGPAWYKGSFRIEGKPADTFLDMSKWGKGMVWVNGRNLGRFWRIGPQQTLFLPGCWLKEGENKILVFDAFPQENPVVSGIKTPILDVLQSDNTTLKHRKAGQNLDLSAEKPVAQGILENNDSWQTIRFDKPVSGRYVCLEALSEHHGSDTMASAAELNLIAPDGSDLNRIDWKVVYADSEEVDLGNNGADKLIDQQESTFWHSEWSRNPTKLPHAVVIDLGKTETVSGFRLLGRTDNNENGRIKNFRFYVKPTPFRF